MKETTTTYDMKETTYENNPCPYCSGNGYIQLLLGGSETCAGCKGSGKM
jgi:DnaJ-class molecular chaperone